MTAITLQPAQRADGVLPYPFHVTADGRVGRQDYWHGGVTRVIGFNSSSAPNGLDTSWREIQDNPELARGKYLVTADKDNKWSCWQQPIESVTVSDGTPGMLAPQDADIKAGRRVQIKDGRIGKLVTGRRKPGKNRVEFDDAPGVIEDVPRHLMWLI
jgi:hypothetical protein